MQKQISKIFFLLIIFFGIFGTAQYSYGATTSSITRHGVTFVFDEEYTYGQFANGDYWVLGPLTITGISPDYDGHSNGWQVNPPVEAQHGFDDGCKNDGFNATLVPNLPYTTTAPVESIVKTISSTSDQACVKTAAVLTVVSSIPANNGATVFRPPYAGSAKPFYSINDMRTDLLPSLPSVGTPPTLASIVDDFSYLRLEHLTSISRRDCRPQDAYGGATSDGYSPEYQPGNHAALLRLMFNDPIQEKMPALIGVLQFGIDQAHIIIDGWETWYGDGHDPGHRIMAAFAAIMLDINAAKTELTNGTNFHEDHYPFLGQNNVSLWGENATEFQYWNYIMSGSGSRSNKDPYGFIDGGTCGEAYQLIVSQGWKGSVLVASLMPEIHQQAWNQLKWPILRDYAVRWEGTGIWSQPDPCAPYTVGGIYEVDYGPDLANPGMCILDTDLEYYNSSTDFACSIGQQCGRYPTKHATGADTGQYKSLFVAAMWDAYYSISPDITPPSAPSGLGVQ